MTTPHYLPPDRRWRLRQLLTSAGIEVNPPPPDVSVTGITDDSRRVAEGSVFVAVRGDRHDGHEFVAAAQRAGAAVIVVDDKTQTSPGFVRVRDTRATLARLAATYYGVGRGAPAPLPLVGITGTNGKSTVAWMVRSIFRHAGRRAALMGTIEYDLVDQRVKAALTTPGALELCRNLAAARRAGAEWGILEVSSHALEQRRCDGLWFCAGVFTNLSGDHLDYHADMDAYFSAKKRLFSLLASDDRAIVNIDDPRGQVLIEDIGCGARSFGLDASGADVSGAIRSMTRTGSVVSVRAMTFEADVRLALIGRHNVQNALAAVAASEATGITGDAIREGLESLDGVPGRLQRVEPAGHPFGVVVDYAHTDAALENVLNALRPLTTGRLICVFGCGGDRDRTKRPRMAAAAGRLADLAVVTSDNPRTEDAMAIIREILPGFGPDATGRTEVEPDRRKAIELAITRAEPGDCVLIAGKGHEDYQLVGREVLHFDDVEVARACLGGIGVKERVA
jgi:UDP-N-acetylmuramoyl-L-alanyl-D-glutamate--2,6-diaminopimelate ligase